MNGNEFQVLVRTALATLSFAWLQMKPELLQTYHQMALDTTPALKGMRAPFDIPVHDLILNTAIRPSQMQTQLLDVVLPVMLVAIQSLAEDALENTAGPIRNAFERIEGLVRSGRIDRDRASTAHQWRIVRNVVAHAGGMLDRRTVDELTRLSAEGLILFRVFKLWGPLLDAGHGGTNVPIVDRAVAAPNQPDSSSPDVAFVVGSRLVVGVADLLAASQTWADLIDAAA